MRKFWISLMNGRGRFNFVNLRIRLLCHTLSKALDMSRKTARTNLFLLMAVVANSMNLKI